MGQYGEEIDITVQDEKNCWKSDSYTRGYEEDIRGRWRLERPVESWEKREVDEVLPDRMASLILVSNRLATISAAFPRGARMKGTCPYVATALKRPFAIRSISSSIICSDDAGELSVIYDEDGSVSVGWGTLGLAGFGGGGRRENKDEDGAINDKYWSTIWS